MILFKNKKISRETLEEFFWFRDIKNVFDLIFFSKCLVTRDQQVELKNIHGQNVKQKVENNL